MLDNPDLRAAAELVVDARMQVAVFRSGGAIELLASASERLASALQTVLGVVDALPASPQHGGTSLPDEQQTTRAAISYAQSVADSLDDDQAASVRRAAGLASSNPDPRVSTPGRDIDDGADLYAQAAHYHYHKATKDWLSIPPWGSPNCLKAGWRAASNAVLQLARTTGEFTLQAPPPPPDGEVERIRAAMGVYESAVREGQHGGAAAAMFIDAVYAILSPGAWEPPAPVVMTAAPGVAEGADQQAQERPEARDAAWGMGSLADDETAPHEGT